ncbi:unnamed protein product [Symbiodinium microadriaticum]|nr:unnamed protein product [Symbiodinium sp. KB8]CAE7881592.1 unnamed protein product [Symbiodinium microadriaticum]
MAGRGGTKCCCCSEGLGGNQWWPEDLGCLVPGFGVSQREDRLRRRLGWQTRYCRAALKRAVGAPPGLAHRGVLTFGRLAAGLGVGL